MEHKENKENKECKNSRKNIMYFFDKKIFIPEYQRTYKWKKIVINEFLNYLKNSKSNFLGQIIIIEKDTSNQIEIIDG